MNSHLLSLSETALLLGCSVTTVPRRVVEGELPAYQLGSSTSPLKFRPQDIEAFLERHRVEPRVTA
jgi:excisionase family DNA binding protein